MDIRRRPEREARKALTALFGRKRLWRPTLRWECAMQRNLARAPSRQNPGESQRIKDAVYEWLEQDPRTRPTQEELTRNICNQLGREKLSKQYVNRLVNELPPRHFEPPIGRHYAPRAPREESERQEPPTQVCSSPKPALTVEEFREKYYAERPWLRNVRK